ncbi:MAG: phosphoribosyltransferase family protein [bacterium]|nr:phosphoribosyltransferase family protein [bacterium]MDZ4248332.1 phosphoribosyltransferase family protein [Patescibacteria group bacterium]
MRFRDRIDAGKQLSAKLTQKLKSYAGQPVVVYALPRGGVPVAAEVARALSAPLDLVIPRKVGHPLSPEYAIAAVTEAGKAIENESEVAMIDPVWYRRAVRNERAEAKRRREAYLGKRKPVSPRGKVAILVDDGIATSLTMRAAVADLQTRGPNAIVIAVPVAPADAVANLAAAVQDVVVCEQPIQFLGSIGAYYDKFDQTTDKEVVRLLTPT